MLLALERIINFASVITNKKTIILISDEENHRERDHERQNYNYKGNRGRNYRSSRGSRNHGTGRNNLRQRQDSDVQEYAADYFPVSHKTL